MLTPESFLWVMLIAGMLELSFLVGYVFTSRYEGSTVFPHTVLLILLGVWAGIILYTN